MTGSALFGRRLVMAVALLVGVLVVDASDLSTTPTAEAAGPGVIVVEGACTLPDAVAAAQSHTDQRVDARMRTPCTLGEHLSCEKPRATARARATAGGRARGDGRRGRASSTRPR